METIFFQECTRVVLPLLLGKMISYFEDPKVSDALYEAYICAAVLSACVLLWAILHHLCFDYFHRVGMRLRVAMSHMIYRKVSVTWYHTVYLLWSIRSGL